MDSSANHAGKDVNKQDWRVEEKMNIKRKDYDRILTQKVLKNVINDSTMVLDIFVVTKENIAKQISMKEVELDDTNGTKNSNE